MKLLGTSIAVLSNAPPYLRGREVFIGLRSTETGDIIGAVKPFTMDMKIDSTMMLSATIDVHHGVEFLQAALDEAWKCGLRPTNWRDERPGEIKRMEDHLTDVRKLLFKASGIK